MNKNSIRFILTDIEGTTTSVNFVYDVLFPYFRTHAMDLLDLIEMDEVKEAMNATVLLAAQSENIQLIGNENIINHLIRWSLEDKKYTPLKTLQGILWKKGYEDGSIKGHVYPEVAPMLRKWHEQGLQLGVFSSGSVKAQQLLFGHSIDGDLLDYFSCYFDTTTGMKRETETYERISAKLNISPNQILFLSDIKEELESADKAGMKTIQLIREGNVVSWNESVSDFNEVDLWLTNN